MCSTLSTLFAWLAAHEQSLAIWLEGLALVAIFGLELKEYRRQGRERIEQHEESVAQMTIMQSQADATRDSATAAKEAAEVARITAGILVQTERGRIIIYWDQVAHMDLSPTGIHDGRLEHCFNWACGNTGRTPVQLTSTYSRFIVVEKLSDLPETPECPVGDEKPYIGEPLQPKKVGRPQTDWFAVPLETTVSFEEIQTRSRSGGCLLYAYGYARYMDIWDNPHVARFGVVRVITDSLMTDFWKVAGPEAYNRSE
jgi:hypothetical protein